jgi:predicted helicase
MTETQTPRRGGRTTTPAVPFAVPRSFAMSALTDLASEEAEPTRIGPPKMALPYVTDQAAETLNTTEKGNRLDIWVANVLLPSLGATDITIIATAKDAKTGKGQDRIDVVATLPTGEKIAIQDKNYKAKLDEGAVHAIVGKYKARKDAAGYDGLMIVAPGGFTEGAVDVLEDEGVMGFEYDGMAEYDLPLDEFLKDLDAAKKTIKFKGSKLDDLKESNRVAIDWLVGLGYGISRLVIPRATGSGKSVIQAGVIAGLGAMKVLALAPSIDLVRQLAKSYRDDLAHLGYKVMIVASREGYVDADTDDGETVRVSTSAYGIPVVSGKDAPAKVQTLMTEPGPWIIVSTYHSMPTVVGPAAKATGTEFDYAVFDEAHRTATAKRDKQAMFAWALDDDRVRIRVRHFYTATPRFVHVKDGVDTTSVYMTTMDNVSQYGPIAEEIAVTLAEAIDKEMVSTFKVFGSVVIDGEIPGGKNAEWGGKYDHYDIAKAVYAIETMQYGKSYLSFHGPLKARLAVDLYRDVAEALGKEVVVMYAGGDSSASDRKEAIDLLTVKDPNKIHIVTNCRLFSEGIDINSRNATPGFDPTLSGIVFFDPRQSTVDIIQIIGRALRLHNDFKTKVAEIIVPVFVPAEHAASVEAFMASSKYSNFYQIQMAVQMQGLQITDVLNVVRDDTAPPVSDKSAVIEFAYKVPTEFNVIDFVRSQIETREMQVPSEAKVDAVAAINAWVAEHGRTPKATGSDEERALLINLKKVLDIETARPLIIKKKAA